MTIFGDIVYKHEVEDAVEATLQKWSESYLGEAGRDQYTNQAKPQRVRSWSRRGEITEWPEDQLPGVVIHCRGIVTGSQRKDADGFYSVAWLVEVGIVDSGGGSAPERATDKLVSVRAGAVRRLLLQHPSLDGFATDVEWTDEDYDRIPDERAIAAGVLEFHVFVKDVVQRRAGPQGTPQDAPRDPYPDPAIATSHNVTVKHPGDE